MTMVELLLALALLSGLTVACVSWTTATSRVLAVEGGRAAWRSAAERALDLVDEALDGEDVTLRGRERWRVAVEDGSIIVRTREAVTAGDGHATVCTAVRLRAAGGALHADWLDDKGLVVARPLLGEVAAFEVDAQELENRRVLLTLRLVHGAGAAVERQRRLAREDWR